MNGIKTLDSSKIGPFTINMGVFPGGTDHVVWTEKDGHCQKGDFITHLTRREAYVEFEWAKSQRRYDVARYPEIGVDKKCQPQLDELFEAVIELASKIDPEIGKHLDGPPTPDTLGILDLEESIDWLGDAIEACQFAVENKS